MKRTFISVTWTPGVDIRDAQILGRTLEDIYRLLRPQFGPIPGQFDPLPTINVFGAWSLPDIPKTAAYANIHFYVKRAITDDGKHLLASRYLETVTLEPWQATSPHFDLIVTEFSVINDVEHTPPQVGVMGFSRQGMVSLISTKPLNTIPSVERAMTLQHIYAHYIGQMFDVPRISRQTGVERVHDRMYCTNSCAMRYTQSASQAVAFAREETVQNVLYCPTCQGDIAAQVTSFHYGLN